MEFTSKIVGGPRSGKSSPKSQTLCDLIVDGGNRASTQIPEVLQIIVVVQNFAPINSLRTFPITN